jgi:hypothetical protein
MAELNAWSQKGKGGGTRRRADMKRIPLVVALLTLAMGVAHSAQASHHRGVDAWADIDANGTLAFLGFEASGPPEALSGQGFAAPPRGIGASAAPGNPDVCRFELTGAVSGTTVTLSGAVTASSNPALVGTPVNVTAEASSGFVIFVFDGITFTGAGSVSIHDTRD